MDKVAAIQETSIGTISLPTVVALLPLLEARRSAIKNAPKATLQYGDDPRHQLDIYYPPISYPIPTSPSPAPILIWIYGGGFNSGDRTHPEPFDLAYDNVGVYFAQQGFIVVIPDYRLYPQVTYPGSAKDVLAAVDWVFKNTAKGSPEAKRYFTTRTVIGDASRVFLMGHSAGAVHVSSLPFLSDNSHETAKKLRGIILFAGPYRMDHVRHNDSDKPTPNYAALYHGSEERVKELQPLTLLEQAPEEKLNTLPRILMVRAEREPEWLITAGEEYAKVLHTKTGKEIDWIIAKVHNHISVNWALCTGQGEAWASEVGQWIRAVSTASPEEVQELNTV